MRTLTLALLVLPVLGCSSRPTEPESGPRVPEFAGPVPQLGSPEVPGAAWASMEPVRGPAGTVLSIAGTGFGAEPGTVTVGGFAATITEWTDGGIEASIPAEATPGTHEVTVAIGGTVLDSRPFEVVLPAVAYLNDDVGAMNSVSAYTIHADATLSALGAPVSAGRPAALFGGDSSSLVVHAPTRKLFVSTRDAIAVFRIDGVTGALQAVEGSPFPTGTTRLFGLTINTDGSRLYAAGFDASVVAGFSISAEGTLAPLPGSPYATSADGGPDTIQLTADGRFLYANLENAQAVEVFAVAGDGALTIANGSPVFYPGSPFVYSMRLDPAGRRLYAPDASQESILVFDLDETGLPSQIAGSPFAAAGSVHGLAFTPDGSRLYAATDDAQAAIHAFAVGGTGALAPLAGSPFASGLQDTASVAVSADGALLMVVDDSNNRLSIYSFDAEGAPSATRSTLGGTSVSGSPSGTSVQR